MIPLLVGDFLSFTFDSRYATPFALISYISLRLSSFVFIYHLVLRHCPTVIPHLHDHTLPLSPHIYDDLLPHDYIRFPGIYLQLFIHSFGRLRCSTCRVTVTLHYTLHCLHFGCCICLFGTHYRCIVVPVFGSICCDHSVTFVYFIAFIYDLTFSLHYMPPQAYFGIITADCVTTIACAHSLPHLWLR